MDNTNPIQPQASQAPAQMETKANSSLGPVIGALIILAVVILGGLYFWNQRQERIENDAETAQEIQNIEAQSSSDDLNSIENDLNNTSIDDLDAQLQ